MEKPMPTGIALHLGLNTVDPASYGGWNGQLNACEADAEDMSSLAEQAGFSSKKLLSQAATRDAVLAEIVAAGKQLKAGDLFLLTYSGHGGQVPDRNNEEDDFLDETWCLFDGELIDDELYACWSRFAANVRILVLSDSCHSGSVVRAVPWLPQPATAPLGAPPLATGSRFVARAMPAEVVSRAYRAKQALYDRLQQDKPKTEDDIAASVLLISGCQDPQTSMDGQFNGAFTSALLRVWNHGTFEGSYRSFHRAIQRLLPDSQQPNLMTLGRGTSFASQRPLAL